MKNICLIGAGNIGSRHLQGLKKLNSPFRIFVCDPSSQSLEISMQRYNDIHSNTKHQISYYQDLKSLPNNIDIALIATNSNVRMEAITSLLKLSKPHYLILEKLLFSKPSDYQKAINLTSKLNCKAFVNCSMRTMPFYYNLKKRLGKGPIDYHVSGSQYGLVTNAIHYIDHLSFLSDCFEFRVDINGLDPKPIQSKRKGFLELNGTLNVHFKDGSCATICCHPCGGAPVIVEIHSPNLRCISKESEKKAWISGQNSNWKWKQITTNLPYQSDMTTHIIEDIIKKGTCRLPTLQESSQTHLQLLNPLLSFLNQHTPQKHKAYPFT